jgi:hypothetical protein
MRDQQNAEAVDATQLHRALRQLHALAATVTRRGVFETNSSSTHSVTIVQGVGDFVPDTLPMLDGVCVVYPGEFGWEEEDYNDAATKASYALTYARYRDSLELLEMLTEVLREGTGVQCVEFRPASADEDYKWGYIDHQSLDCAQEVFESVDTLRAFIFNPASTLSTSGNG